MPRAAPISVFRLLPLLISPLMVGAGCTGADVYGVGPGEPASPDRIAFAGKLCTEDTSGSSFPVKILFIVDSSNDMFIADPDADRLKPPPGSPPGSLGSIRVRYGNLPHVYFGFMSVASFPQALPTPDGQRFFRPQDPEVDQAIQQLSQPRGTGRDVTAALTAAESFILNDMNLSPPGEVLRSRYLITMLMAGPPVPSAPIDAIADQVERMADVIYSRGALEFRLNTNLLYFGPKTIDQGASQNYNCYVGDAADLPCLCPGSATTYCGVYCALPGVDWGPRVDRARNSYEAAAFAGGGVFFEYNCPPSIDLNVDVARSNVDLVKKDILAFNRSVQLGPTGPMVDSDGDGLADFDEKNAPIPTNHLHWDTDGDGISDRVEARMYPQQDANNPFDRPPSCPDPAFGIPDRDFDLLNDCEEGLLQANPTVPDSDGDGLPDLVEFLGGTIPTSPDDRLLDFDADGISNAQEILEHTNPRSNDAELRGSEGYRNTVQSLGRQTVPEMENPVELLGVSFRQASPEILPGQCYLKWDACAQTLAWSDARFPVGNPTFTPEPLQIDGTDIYTLFATAPNGRQIWAEFQVVVEQMPTCDQATEVEAFPLCTTPVRECYDFKVSNIKLMQTEAAVTASGATEEGDNLIQLFFTQSPQNRLASPGIAKVGQQRINFRCADLKEPLTCRRDAPAVIELTNADLFSAD